MAEPDRFPPATPAGGQTKADRWRRQREREDRAARWAAVCFLVAIVAALSLFAVYVSGGQVQLEGLALFVAFAGVGLGIAIWVRVIVGHEEVIEERYPMRSDDAEREAFEELYEATLGEAGVGGRRRFLVRLLTGAGASLGLALLIPIRSLGPGPENDLFRTEWDAGARVVDAEGEPLRAEDISPDQVVTVFPEGATGSADSQAILVGLRTDVETDLRQPTVDGIVVYSKICTHAGCPVGLYRAAVGELLCPCHQSTFGVYNGAVVLSGPAGRPLPQLPIALDDDGYLVALGDFVEPVGPSFWNMTRGGGS
ncbi:MAG: ubiquinol-cytochrome c reductase iron-sulfur subunit [Actinobacteria bacterium]|nr:ubiquinol-cytochrome c reductase iron-sulfur subunit [Actinomycetota bacterium]